MNLQNSNLPSSINFSAIEPHALEQLMHNSGWRKIKTYDGIASVWQSPEEKTTKWIPLSHTYEDYAELAQEAWLAANNGKTADPI